MGYGLDNGMRTSPMIAGVIEEEFGVQYHPGHVRKLLHAGGFGLEVHQLPPYLPELNPRERLWQHTRKTGRTRWPEFNYYGD